MYGVVIVEQSWP